MKIYTILGEKKKTGLCSVFVQIWLNRQRVLINTKVDADRLLFDADKGHIKGKGDESYTLKVRFRSPQATQWPYLNEKDPAPA